MKRHDAAVHGFCGGWKQKWSETLDARLSFCMQLIDRLADSKFPRHQLLKRGEGAGRVSYRRRQSDVRLLHCNLAAVLASQPAYSGWETSKLLDMRWQVPRTNSLLFQR